MSYQYGVEYRGAASHSATPRPPLDARFEGLLAIEASRLLDEVRTALDHDLEEARAGAARLAALLTAKAREVPLSRAERQPSRGGLAPWQARRVDGHIAGNLDSAISIEGLAAIAALSPSHFCRAFKDSFGEPPHAYVMRRRVERAQHLMLTTGEPLSQIALACGLADQAHLSKLFRRTVGQTPSAWRRARRTAP